ncbi:hypothetical protein F9802_06115 [Bacillus aerolatus]|uniref:Uncharacterized protein n=1 Tax=Bacillus aerolatus TaxID=2653354 RepID=A0A6I1FIW5_9BACI|nr:hypothetical protein [Bacillus aerolatus]KAB7708272.1 hypothetical protein F9802_06115 [Bacillus aerolatus]
MLERFKERQLTIDELLEAYKQMRDETVEKEAGKTKSGLTKEQEPYFNKFMEVYEERGEEAELKEWSVDVHQYFEAR